MNGFILTSGIVAALCTIGHFVIGPKEFLKPMLAASFDSVPKKVMHSVFHYVSVNLVLASAALLYIGMGFYPLAGSTLLVKFIAVHFFAYTAVQIIIALTSDIKNGVFKLFQWTFFILIAVFAWLGA